MAKTKQIEVSVVGLNYRATVSTLKKLASEVPVQCALEREPENEHDENAIKVVITEKPWRRPHGGFHIGYVKRETAAAIAPALDAGTFPFNRAWLMSVDPETGRGEMSLEKVKPS